MGFLALCEERVSADDPTGLGGMHRPCGDEFVRNLVSVGSMSRKRIEADIGYKCSHDDKGRRSKYSVPYLVSEKSGEAGHRGRRNFSASIPEFG
jgi:hypothetical protein